VEIVRLRMPDTGVARREGELRDRLAELVNGFGICLAPWDGDLHADHEAAGRAAFDACSVTGVGLLSYPIWAWHWAHPRDSRVPWDRAVRVPLSPEAAGRKQVAIDCFTSQLRPRGPERAPVLPPEVIAHFIRDQEVLIR
jgi:LmbE family N-acetylglucosaminyl deacetylase